MSPTIEVERRVCIDCQGPFVLSLTEVAWFKSAGFELPRRCLKCRRARRVQREKQRDEEKAKVEKA